MRNKQLPIITATLPNGLRMVHVHESGAASGIFGVFVHAGSRNDPSGQYGMAHFVEHTLFKGTTKRSSWHIINRMEAVGGELNAYTTKEETVVYTVFPGASPARGAELIADLVFNSQFPERELVKEREVVADEINSYLDTPSEAVFDDFEELAFAGTSLAHNILGDEKSLATFTPEECRAYMNRWYDPTNMCAFYCGPQSAARTFECVARYFGHTDRTPARHVSETITGAPYFEQVRSHGNHQAHTVMGAVLPCTLRSPERFALALLTNIIGGPGMNSLLNVELRERRGLVYSVEASSTLLTDCGMTTVYFGCDPEDTDTCKRLTRNVLTEVADGRIDKRALQRAVKQYIGQWTISRENRENLVLGAARSTLLSNGPMDREQTLEAIRSVSVDDIRTLAAKLVNMSSLTLS